MPFSLVQQIIAALRRARYPGSRRYWEARYAGGGHSGAGSTGILARYKAGVVNEFVAENGIQSVLELGCGDGSQLQLAEYPAYTGLDIAPSAVEMCRRQFSGHPNRRFEIYQPERFNPADFQADMSLSMEVIFHLTEQEDYLKYMEHLFASARRWVVIFSSDGPDQTGGVFPHFKPRPFSADVPAGWTLRRRLENPHRDISISDFFFFEKA